MRVIHSRSSQDLEFLQVYFHILFQNLSALGNVQLDGCTVNVNIYKTVKVCAEWFTTHPNQDS